MKLIGCFDILSLLVVVGGWVFWAIFMVVGGDRRVMRISFPKHMWMVWLSPVFPKRLAACLFVGRGGVGVRLGGRFGGRFRGRC